MKKFILFCVMSISLAAQAGWQEGRVTSILVRQSDGLHYFYMSGSATDRPACAEGHAYWMIKDENSNVGKNQLSMILTAYASGATIHVIGAGECSRWIDGEDVNLVILK